MKPTFKIVFLLFISTFLGCSSAGNIKNIQEKDKVSQVKISSTTQKDVYELFGEPTYRGTKPDGETWWAYYYPGSGEGASLSIDFDKDGRVKSYNYIP